LFLKTRKNSSGGGQMARIEESVDIRRPVDKVFTYTTEAKSWPLWQSIITDSEQTSHGPWRVGATFQGTSRMMGLNMKWTARATDYELNRRWSKNIFCGPMSIAEQVTYDPVVEGIKFTIVYDMKVGGLFKLFSPMILNSMRKETRKSLNNLKSILET
jgi:hypothetical protein